MTGGFNGNIIIVCEVYTCVGLGGIIWYTEQLTLNTLIRWTWNMFAVLPLAVTGSTGRAATTTTTV